MIAPAALSVATALFSAGCLGTTKPDIAGTVTLDGQPLKRGNILFQAEGEGGKRAFADVADGRIYLNSAYHDLSPGRYRVEIRSPESTGRWITPSPKEPAVMETTELLPAKYHEQSELSIDLKAGENVLKFELQSK
jgi:hypothetical protein